MITFTFHQRAVIDGMKIDVRWDDGRSCYGIKSTCSKVSAVLPRPEAQSAHPSLRHGEVSFIPRLSLISKLPQSHEIFFTDFIM